MIDTGGQEAGGAGAAHDEDTGARSAEFLVGFLEKLNALAERQGRSVAVLCVRLQGLDEFLDELPGTARRVALREVAERLAASVRATDTVARAPDGAFLLALADLAGREGADAAATRLLAQFQREIRAGTGSRTLGAGIGVALFPDDARLPDDLVRLARTAAAHTRRDAGRIVFHRPPPAGAAPPDEVG